MGASEHANLIRRVYEAVNADDRAALGELFAPDMVRHELTDLVAHSESGDAVTDFLGMLRRAIPDLHMNVEDVFSTDDGRVAARTTLTGTQRGEFLGRAPTGRRATFAAITLYRIEAGRIAEAWSLVDWAGALRQFRGE
jgi:steroid delta-isomerase-like uncharacterized protein